MKGLYKIKECGYCARKIRANIHTTHGGTFAGKCKKCGAEYTTINNGQNWYCLRAGKEGNK